MKRVYLPGLNGEPVDVTPAPRWIMFLIRHDLPWRRANYYALGLRAIWDEDARACFKRLRSDR